MLIPPVFLAFLRCSVRGRVWTGGSQVAMLTLAGWCAASSIGTAEDNSAATGRSAAQLLPPSVVVYVEAAEPQRVVETLLQHPQRKRLEALPQFQAALQSDQLLKLKAAVSVFEAGMGQRWQKVLEQLTAGGVTFAIDMETNGVALLMQAANPEIIEQMRDTVFSLVRAGKPAGSPEDPIKSGEYRGVTAYKLANDIYVMQVDDWLVATNKGDFGKAIVDRCLESGLTSLASLGTFDEAYSTRTGNETAWGFVSIASLRESGAAAKLYSGKTDNILAELLAGGVVSTLQHTAFAQLQLEVTKQDVQLSARMPYEREWAGEERAYFFGADGLARVAAAPRVSDPLFSIGLHRELSEMWLRSGDLLTEKGSDQLTKADSQLSLFFGGRDFGEDILSLFAPEVYVVGQLQVFGDAQPTPSIQLPAFAAVLELEEDDQTQADLRRVFQSLVGFLNIAGGMNGQPQLDLGMETDAGYQLVTATYVALGDAKTAKNAAIQYNFSPTLGFSGRRLILASTTSLARELAQPAEAKAGQPVAVEANVNSFVEVDANVLRQVLLANREQLVAQNMLEKGHRLEQAEGEVDLLFELLKIIKTGRLALLPSTEELGLSLEIQVHAE